jgi:LPS-assembly lipoprotein
VTRFAILAFSLAAVGGMISGCGFTPLYASPGVTKGLANIDVISPSGRVGFLLRQSLDDDLGHDKGAPAAYRLEMTLTETQGPRGLTRTDVADYYDVGLTVHYSLIAADTGKVVSTGDVASQVSYDDSGAAYADIAAAQDADNRIAADAARRIEIKLAAWLARQHKP